VAAVGSGWLVGFYVHINAAPYSIISRRFFLPSKRLSAPLRNIRLLGGSRM
jgi:hypothetical protein